MQTDAALLCNKPPCKSLHDITDGSAHKKWISFYNDRHDSSILKIPLRLYSDGTAKRNLKNAEIHVFRVCLAVKGRYFLLPNSKLVSFDVAYRPNVSIWKNGTRYDKKNLSKSEQTSFHKIFYGYLLDNVLRQLVPACKSPFDVNRAYKCICIP